MAKHYTLLSGEKINLESLKKDERKHINSLENRIKNCKNHDREDYFSVAIPVARLTLTEGEYYTARRLKESYDSNFYRIATDLIMRYWYRCFSEEKNFEEHIKKHGMEEEYSRYLEQSDSVLMALDSAAAKVGLYPIRQNRKPKK